MESGNEGVEGIEEEVVKGKDIEGRGRKRKGKEKWWYAENREN